jgi:hypothetical protein
MLIPREVAEVRQSVCRDSCTQQCGAFIAGTLNHSDPRVSCPRSGWLLAWGCYGPCKGPTPPIPKRARQKGPGVAAKARRLGSALTRWSRAGFPMTQRGEREARRAVCSRCEHWSPDGNAGLGECAHPSCGCTRAKRALATERCPLGKWPEVPLRSAFSALANALKRPFLAVRNDLQKPADS